MIDFASARLSDLLAPEGFPCDCGKVHRAHVSKLLIGSGAIGETPAMLSAMRVAHPFVVCDVNTYAAAGAEVVRLLSAQGIPHSLFVYPDHGAKIEPDEAAVGALLMAFDPACDVVVAVGSGVIGDCCKVLAHATGRPQLTVATAPSMDGFASASSSMIQNGIKVTLYNRCPDAILCDTDILRNAPMHMLHAGLGDMLAKYISLCEWRISHLVTGEYYCEHVAALVRRALRKCVQGADGLLRREPASVEAVAQGLVLSGIAMNFADISRPASGLEHYFSHLWEMFALIRGEPSDLHGIQVGVGTLLTLDLLGELRKVPSPDRARAELFMRSFDVAVWEDTMREIFGPVAGAVIDAERAAYHKNDPARHAERLERIVQSWPQILAIIDEELPPPGEIAQLMQRLGMPMRPEDIGVGGEDTRNALIGSREIRDKYLTSSLLWDLGLLGGCLPG